MYGPTWFLDNVAKATGLSDDLQKVFGGNAEMAQDVLTLAYFLFLDSRTYSHIEKWQRIVKTPSVHTLTSSSITRLSQSITEQNRMDLFRLRARRMGKDEYCAVDSTSISTYGFHLVDIRWGHHKEHLPLKQTLEVIVYSLTSHMPIYYLELPGNMPDSRTIEMIVPELEHAGFKNVVLITDRGYESMKNPEVYIANNQKVIISVKCGQGEALKAIKAIDLSTGVPEGMAFSKDNNLFYKQYDLDYKVQGSGDHIIEADRLRLNAYFDIHKRADDLARVQMAITTQTEVVQAMYESGKPVPKEDRETFRKENNSLYAMLSASRFLKDAVQPTPPRSQPKESAVVRLSHRPRLLSTNNCKTQINMFQDCSSLKKAPVIKGVKIAGGDRHCCQMFYGCTSLEEVQEQLFDETTVLYPSVCDLMFYECTSLKKAPALPSMNLSENCYYQMFLDCTSLVDVPESLPATKLSQECYSEMFKGCSSLITAPKLPAETLASGCYKYMFDGCTSLKEAWIYAKGDMSYANSYMSRIFFECPQNDVTIHIYNTEGLSTYKNELSTYDTGKRHSDWTYLDIETGEKL